MKKIFILVLSIVLLASVTWASKWSDYGTLSTIAAADTFLVLDASDSSLGVTGTQKEFNWTAMGTCLDTANYARTDDTETVSVKWTFDDNIFILESAAADADVAGDGQIWIKSDAPNILMFTDDVGSDFTVVNLEANQAFSGDITFSGDVVLPNGVVDLADMSINSIDSDQYVDGSIDTAHIATDQVTNDKMADNSIDSDDYVDGSIDLVHMSVNSIDSDQYVDGSIDLIHLSVNSVDSDQYVDGSIDAVHIADLYAYETVLVADMKDGTSAPAALDDASTRTAYTYRDFDDAADEDLNFVWFVPADLSGAVVQFRVYYLITNATGPSAEGVAFGLSGISAGDNDASNGTKGTVVVVTDGTLTAVQHDVIITGWSGDVTITALAAGEVAEMALIRDVSDAVDDYAQDVGVCMLQLRYVQNPTR